MDIHRIEMLLKEVSHISREYEKMAKLSGENFNIFRTLNLATAEVRLHSAILAEFLNPKGSHGQDDLFLDLFVKQFEITDFDTKKANAELEKYTGRINSDYTEGGYIDIFITNDALECIIIENKINAGDQPNQLLRYYNAYPKARLFYLTRDGCPPSDYSTNGGELGEEKYKIISYKYDIIKWLEACKKEAVSLPIIRETITQYINHLKSLTGQTTMEKMKDEIKKLIRKNPEIAEHACVINDCLEELKSECQEKFIEKLAEKVSGFNSTPKYIKDTIQFCIASSNNFFKENNLTLLFEVQGVFGKNSESYIEVAYSSQDQKTLSGEGKAIVNNIKDRLSREQNYFQPNTWCPAGGNEIAKDNNILTQEWLFNTLSNPDSINRQATEYADEINRYIVIIEDCVK